MADENVSEDAKGSVNVNRLIPAVTMWSSTGAIIGGIAAPTAGGTAAGAVIGLAVCVAIGVIVCAVIGIAVCRFSDKAGW